MKHRLEINSKEIQTLVPFKILSTALKFVSKTKIKNNELFNKQRHLQNYLHS